VLQSIDTLVCLSLRCSCVMVEGGGSSSRSTAVLPVAPKPHVRRASDWLTIRFYPVSFTDFPTCGLTHSLACVSFMSQCGCPSVWYPTLQQSGGWKRIVAVLVTGQYATASGGCVARRLIRLCCPSRADMPVAPTTLCPPHYLWPVVHPVTRVSALFPVPVCVGLRGWPLLPTSRAGVFLRRLGRCRLRGGLRRLTVVAPGILSASASWTTL